MDRDVTPTYAEVDAALTGPGCRFEIEEVPVRGIPTRVWKDAPASLRAVLDHSRDTHRTSDFIVLGDERVGHDEHHRRVARFAGRLVDDHGVQRGDRVVIAMRNYPEWSVAFFAVTAIGAVAVPLNAWWTGDELAFAIEDSEARVVVADGARLAALAPVVTSLDLRSLIGVRVDDRAEGTTIPNTVVPYDDVTGDATDELPPITIDTDDDATLFYTSGTTGRPKGVLGTHRNICSNLVSLRYVGARRAMRSRAEVKASASGSPVQLTAVPFFHATGCHSILVSSLYFGGTIVLMRKWDPAVAVELIERERVTSLAGVPTMVWELLHAPNLAHHDLSSLTAMGGGGAAAPPEILRRAGRTLPGRGLSTGYGLTETSSLVTSNSGDDYASHPDSVGVPVPVCRVRIVADDGRDASPGSPGEIWIQGPNVVKGYWNRPEETAATFTDGWCRTGDIGRIDRDGFLSIVDRAKDIVIRGGENISSAEVEAVLFEHPAVADVAAVGVPHPSLGEELAVVVVLRAEASVTADELRTHVGTSLAAFKVPAHVHFRPEPLPRNPAGKVQKDVLRSEIGDLPA